MTEPESPTVPTPSSPTPEEISARLEALLKRTHALRAQQPAPGTGGPLTMTWPPPDRELDRYDVVDVPDECPVRAAAESEAESTPAAAESTPAAAESAPAAAQTSSAPAAATVAPSEPAVAVAVAATPASVARTEWNELRLRTPDEPSRSPGWGWLLTVALAIAAVGQAGYIWYLKSGAPVTEPGRIRVDAPDGADVRIGGRSIGTAPVEHSLDAGDYDIEVVHQGQVVRADRVIVGPGRTVVLLTPSSGASAGSGAAGNSAATPQGQAAAPRGAAPVDPELVSATTGAVTIESTPPGQPVTMGGRPRGVTPLTLGKIPPGRHDVLVGVTTRQVDVTAGEVTTLRVPR